MTLSRFSKTLLFFLSCVIPIWGTPADWNAYKEQTFKELPSIQGWCSKEKAAKIMDVIFQHQPKVCVEIGAMGGSTTFPIVRSLMYMNKGTLYAIDAWDNKAAVDGLETNFPSFPFWSSVNMNETYDRFIRMLSEKKLESRCIPIKMLSQDAVNCFADGSIDFLYIDGNFSSTGFLQDVLLYFPKVRKGGYILFNDPIWSCKIKGLSFLMNNCTWEKSFSDVEGGWIVFKNELEVPKQQKLLVK